MKMCKKEERNVTTKTVKSGISLIVLVITIIVIIILSTAILVSVISNNPIDEANKARYESDRDNMQAVFTNTVAKVMAQNQGTVSVTAGQINSVISGVKETTGQVSYTVTNAVNSANASGTIVFDKGENTDIVYYTGKQLPIYKAGDTKWYVSEEGEILLEVAQNKYGEGEITFAPGAYDANNVMLASWDELVNDYGLDIESNYNSSTCKTSPSSMYSVLNNNENLNATTKIVIDNNVVNIGKYSFYECANLTKIEIPNSVTAINDFAFCKCTALTSIKVPDSVMSMGSGVFSLDSGLTSVTIGNSITSIEMSTFNGCINLTSVTIPESVTSIGMFAFNTCEKLKSIVIPKSVTNIASLVFANCFELTSIKVDEENTKYDSRDNCNAIVETATNALVTVCKTSVIPNSVTTIKDNAFYYCSGITSIGPVGSGAALEIPDSVTTIGGDAFRACSELVSVTIPKSVTNIDIRAFAQCDALVSIKVDEENTKYDSRDNCNAIIETATNKLIQGCSATVIPDSVTNINKYGFFGCLGFESITIPETVTSIGSYTFTSCDNLKTIYYKGTATGAPWGAPNATVVSEY